MFDKVNGQVEFANENLTNVSNSLRQCNLDQHAFLPCPTITI
jgi:hypothetical protein